MDLVNSLRKDWFDAEFNELSDEAADEIERFRRERGELLAAANQCRLDLLHQIHELVDHIERANHCISDPDMLKQINGQSEFAMSIASKWNQNGNPFETITRAKGGA